MFWIIFGVIAGLTAILLPIVIHFWDEIKAWVKAIIPGIVSMLKGVFTGKWELVKEGWSYVKRVSIWMIEHGQHKMRTYEEIIPPDQVPQEIKEKLKQKQKISQDIEGMIS
jgi:hypothetical protein